MKKIAIFLAVTLLACLFLSSCKSSERCSAYGEVHKFQVEQGY